METVLLADIVKWLSAQKEVILVLSILVGIVTLFFILKVSWSAFFRRKNRKSYTRRMFLFQFLALLGILIVVGINIVTIL